MKKIILPIIALIVVLALGIFLIGKAPATPAETGITETLETPAEVTEDFAASEQNVLQDEPTNEGSANPCFGFGNVDLYISGDDISLTGTVLDDASFVQLYCSGSIVGTYDVTGQAFNIATTYQQCAPGTAEIKYECNGVEQTTSEDIPSQIVFMAQTRGGSSTTTTQSFSQPSHMPVFPSVLTLGLAIIGVGLGLALLRKK